MRIVIALFFTCISLSAFSQNYQQIKDNLEGYVDVSIKNRESVMPTIEQFGYNSPQMDSLNLRISFNDSLHLRYVVQVLEEFGWLGVSQVGKKANISIFLAIQHAPKDQTRERYFPMLKASAELGESGLGQMATMEDRISISKKQPQQYGTQWNLVNEQQVLYPIDDKDKINDRRKLVGLPPLSDQDLNSAQTKFQ